MVNEILQNDVKSVACVATPSLFFSLKEVSPEIFSKSVLLDIDKQFEKEKGYIYYNYKENLNLSDQLLHSFDCVVIDPPFITRDAWERFSLHGRLLGTKDCKFICSSVAENKEMLEELLSGLSYIIIITFVLRITLL
jgi:hypothetical protein